MGRSLFEVLVQMTILLDAIPRKQGKKSGLIPEEISLWCCTGHTEHTEREPQTR